MAATSSIDLAVRRVMQGQERKAVKILCSNGVAEVNEDTLEVLSSLHPPLTKPLVESEKSFLKIISGSKDELRCDRRRKGE